MTQVTHRELLPGVRLTAVQTNKFKSNLLSIGRPDRIGFIRGLCGELNSCSSLCRDFINVTLVTKNNF